MKKKCDYQTDSYYVHNNLIEFKERSRRSNTRIDGIAERKGKTLDEYQEQIQELLLEKFNLNVIKIDGTTDSKFSDTKIIKYLKIQIN